MTTSLALGLDTPKPAELAVARSSQPEDINIEPVLRDSGYRIRFVQSRADVLEAVRCHPRVDCVVLSSSAPEVDAYDTCRRIKNDSRTRLMPVVLLIPSLSADARLLAVSSGADACMQTPIEPGEFRWRLRHLLEHKRIVDSLENAETVILSLARAIEAKDRYTHGHVERVSCYAVEIGRRLGLDQDNLEALHRGGIVHDLGKIAISDTILNKHGPLNDDEWRIMKQHPVVGYDLLKPLRTFASCLPCVRWHHECPNGTGYPDGLVGDELPVLARIMAVCDCFDALTTARPYREAMTAARAVEVMRESARCGKADGEIVEVMAKAFPVEMAAGSPRREPQLAGAAG